jgi:hypothetical protein
MGSPFRISPLDSKINVEDWPAHAAVCNAAEKHSAAERGILHCKGTRKPGGFLLRMAATRFSRLTFSTMSFMAIGMPPLP